jgi:AcrR family transcriptional regulator
MSRKEQKQQTRQRIIDGAFTLLNDNKSFTTISLREVAREANIAPTSFYRHFSDINELGLTLVDESGLALRQLMRQARKRIASGGSIIDISVDTFIEFILKNPNVFRLLLREHTGTSSSFRAAVKREIHHFTNELADYIVDKSAIEITIAHLQSEAMVKLVFSAGAEAIDAESTETVKIAKRVKTQLRFIEKGALQYSACEQKRRVDDKGA